MTIALETLVVLIDLILLAGISFVVYLIANHRGYQEGLEKAKKQCEEKHKKDE